MKTTMLARAFLCPLAVAVLLTGGCTNDAATVTNIERAHPVNVEGRLVTMPFNVAASTSPFSAVEGERFDRFVTSFIRLGGNAIEFAVPKGGSDDVAPLALAKAVRDRARARGVRDSEIRIRFAEVGGEGPVVVSYERFAVSTSACEDYSSQFQSNDRNVAHSNFGCATMHNMAKMISNPADLAGAQERTPANMQRRGLVLENYRAGRNTESALGPLAGQSSTTGF